MHLLLLPSASPVVSFVHSSFSHEDCRLPGPSAACSSTTLDHADLRWHSLVEDDVIHVRHMEPLFTNTGRHQNIVFAISEILEDLHLFALVHPRIVVASTGLAHESDCLDLVDPVQIICYAFDRVSKLSKDYDLGVNIRLQVVRNQFSKLRFFRMRSLLEGSHELLCLNDLGITS